MYIMHALYNYVFKNGYEEDSSGALCMGFSQRYAQNYIMLLEQAIDIISGGVKSNALPEQSSAVVNHRIVDDSSVGAVKKRVTKILSPIASKIQSFLSGSLIISDGWGRALEPAPVSPSDSAPYDLLSATIKASVYDSRIIDKEVIVAPGIMTGSKP
ncbi:hypothetical protein M422DRAFT_49959 [Sphaerobolus stellatus SS14]|uniref:Peptidase M20 dimerisation domain-containing protein n=1 Tax=Sphaerobolus stellatus (strain SS14) TaxID=990650 RepID=A0A0C9VKZ2_SPHS4|nr:hypothetical protein M422DRAFT_49959 [Sphaerobolus stellatus SS14]